MQNLFQQILGLTGEDEIDEEAAERQHRRTLGFARQQHQIGLGLIRGAHFGSVIRTEGQQRRAQARAARVIEKREGRRQRRLKVRNDAARSTLRGQLQVLGTSGPAGQAYIARQLEERYGSVTAAIAHAARIQIAVHPGAAEYAAAQKVDA